MHMSISTAASGCRSPRPSAVGSEALQAVLDELLKASGRTPPGASSGPRRIDLWPVNAGALFCDASRRHGACADGVQASSRTNSQSCTGLPAEQGVLLNNQSSAGFETSPGVSRHFERPTDRALGFFYDLRSSTQPRPAAHAYVYHGGAAFTPPCPPYPPPLSIPVSTST